jgi:hypothetical protein
MLIWACADVSVSCTTVSCGLQVAAISEDKTVVADGLASDAKRTKHQPNPQISSGLPIIREPFGQLYKLVRITSAMPKSSLLIACRPNRFYREPLHEKNDISPMHKSRLTSPLPLSWFMSQGVEMNPCRPGQFDSQGSSQHAVWQTRSASRQYGLLSETAT